MPRGKRSKDQTQVSISLSRELLKEVDALAENDNRPRSNWIVTVLMRHVEQRRAKEKLEGGAPGAPGAKSPSTNEDAPPRGAGGAHPREARETSYRTGRDAK